MQKSLLGIEIGGTKLQVVLGDANGTISSRRRYSVAKAEGGAGIRRHIETAIRELRSEADFGAIGVGFGGPVNWTTGRIACSHHIEGWNDFPLGEWLAKLAGVPVVVDNDANVAALAEARHGAAIGFNPAFYITLGSGVGGGVIVDGSIYHGAVPGEVEIGHVRLDREGTIVESRCSGWSVDAKIRAAIVSDSNSYLAQHAPKTPGGEAKLLAPALAANDATAARILYETAGDIAFALSHVSQLFHPEIMVMGGGLSLVGEPLRLAVQAAIKSHIMHAHAPGPMIALAQLGEDVVPVGAVMLAAVRL